jgi:phytoene desaturase
VFEAYFERFGKKVSDYYELIRLEPGYTIVFGENDRMTVPGNMAGIEAIIKPIPYQQKEESLVWLSSIILRFF